MTMEFGTDYRRKREDAISARQQAYMKQRLNSQNSPEEVIAYVLQPDGTMAPIKANDRTAFQSNQQMLNALRAEQVAQEYGQTTGRIHSASGGNRRLTGDMIEVLTSERGTSQSSTPPFSPSSSGVTVEDTSPIPIQSNGADNSTLMQSLHQESRIHFGSLPLSPPMTPPRQQTRPNIPPPRYTPRATPHIPRYDSNVSRSPSRPATLINSPTSSPRQNRGISNGQMTANHQKQIYDAKPVYARPVDSPRSQSQTVLEKLDSTSIRPNDVRPLYASQVSMESPSKDVNSPFIVFSNNNQQPPTKPSLYQLQLKPEIRSPDRQPNITIQSSRQPRTTAYQVNGTSPTLNSNCESQPMRRRPMARARSQPRMRTTRSQQDMGIDHNSRGNSWVRADNSWMREDKSKVPPPRRNSIDDDYVYLESRKIQRVPSVELVKPTEPPKRNSLKIVSKGSGKVLRSPSQPDQIGSPFHVSQQQRGRAEGRGDNSLIGRVRRGRSVEPKMTRQKVNIESYQRDRTPPRTLPKPANMVPINRNGPVNQRKIGYSDL